MSPLNMAVTAHRLHSAVLLLCLAAALDAEELSRKVSKQAWVRSCAADLIHTALLQALDNKGSHAAPHLEQMHPLSPASLKMSRGLLQTTAPPTTNACTGQRTCDTG